MPALTMECSGCAFIFYLSMCFFVIFPLIFLFILYLKLMILYITQYQYRRYRDNWIFLLLFKIDHWKIINCEEYDGSMCQFYHLFIICFKRLRITLSEIKETSRDWIHKILLLYRQSLIIILPFRPLKVTKSCICPLSASISWVICDLSFHWSILILLFL